MQTFNIIYVVIFIINISSYFRYDIHCQLYFYIAYYK